ncbi:dihydrodipicolinate synthase family protein [Agrobacterium larrymoorei]|uniref:Dihydrodipicolinate synthase family protein n=1 Tax=Agrobacterium larrymoorei TaxID=160699 RepID=A0A4D7DYS2_9HYPH|nr:dihydrodipicolinate synthase family protein [Agrobacterium larrymoorei]QCI99332.1 dihydrodipicolinate synthase family protein [Agrobacterium larrymoorei]QYA08872.1 dihydrodipicolinate synthase family protein [Agrobacterium larrymoorei]
MSHINSSTKGVFVIAVTPFNEDGSLDNASVDRMVDFYYEKGADGLTILGMMGEAPKLTQAESIEVARQTIKRSGDKPVVVGVSAPGLAAIGELTKAVMDLGAAGVMVAPPSSLKTDEQIIGYYRNVVETVGTDVPVVLQDFPLSTGVQISSKTLGTILEAHPSIVMVKHEDWPGLQKITDLRQAEANGRRRTSILCGNAGVFLTEELQRGADGAMTGFPYPEMMVGVCRLSQEGRFDDAQDLFDAYLPLMRYEQQPGLGLAVRKYILMKRGAIASAAQRRPGTALSRLATAEVEKLMERQTKKLELLN